jgi:rfaE bifunctional protein kinase chain/domain/rfaE bifunctional protein nucleotidyltransferase chain/domain
LGAGNKIKSLEELEKILREFRRRKEGTKIVHCHGVFDLLHIGHIRYLEQAKKLGDVLIVTLTPDQYVNKGPHRPAFSENLRAEVLSAINCVDYVSINEWPTASETIKLIQPDIFAKGAEFRDKPTEELIKEKSAVEGSGGEVAFIEDITSSSSSLINKYLDIFPEEVRKYLAEFSLQFPLEEILGYIDNFRSLKVLVIGDTIIDEYQYCESIGKASKEPALVAKSLATDIFAGGILAVSNHVANFCDEIDLLTVLGTVDSREDFIKENLKSNIGNFFLQKENTPTTIKRRFIDDYLLSKYFEIYIIDDRELTDIEDQRLCNKLEEILPNYDVVLVADFGHGMLSKDAIDLLCQNAKFLAVNTQINAGNRGFNTILKYPRADYACLNEDEFRLELRDKHGQLNQMMMQISERLGNATVTATRGSQGSLCYKRENGFVSVPALATKVVDRVGAGDAVFALTSLLVAQDVPMEVVGFVGNTVGALAVSIIGNKSSVEKKPLIRSIQSFLK